MGPKVGGVKGWWGSIGDRGLGMMGVKGWWGLGVVEV